MTINKAQRLVDQHDFGDVAQSRVKDSTSRSYDPSVKKYTYDKKKQEMSVKEKGKQEKKIPASVSHEKELKNASLRVAIDELLNKAKSYPKVEGYLRGIDKRRIDNDEDVPVTKRETAVRTADENAAKKLESQGKSMNEDLVKSIDALLEKAEGPDFVHNAGPDKEGKGGRSKSETYQEESGRQGKLFEKPRNPETRHYEHKGRQGHEKTTKKEVNEYDKEKGVVKRTTTLDPHGKHPVSASRDISVSDEKTLKRSIDALLEKAVYGVGTRGGKIEKPGTGKNPKNHGKVSRPSLSKEQQEKILRTSQEKASRGLAREGQHKEAEKVSGQKNTVKSLDERTADLMKALNVDYGRRKSGYKRGGSIQDPDAGIDRKKEERMDAEGVGTKNSAIKDGGRRWTAEDKTQKSLDSDLEKSLARGGGKVQMDEKARAEREDKTKREMKEGKESKLSSGGPGGKAVALGMKSIDDRTSDLHKGFSAEKVGGAVGRAYVSGNPDKQEQSKRVAEKWHGKDKTPGAQGRYNEAMTNEVWSHNLKTAEKSMKDVAAMWQTDSPYISKGGRVVVQGGKPATLVKDDTPSYVDTDKQQEDVDSGKVYREQKAKKRVEALKDEQDHGS